MQDGKEITEYILEYMSVDKITLMGHSWGSIYGANLALAYPEYYNCFIGCGQLVDVVENEIAFKEVARQWATDEKGQDLVDKLTPERLTMEHFDVKNKILEKYGYHMLANGRDYNLFFARYFNPFYSVLDYAKYSKANNTAYETFIESEEFLSFSLKDKYKYAVPFFNVNGDKDFQANYLLANEYFKNVQAPRKNMFLMKNMTHGLLESNSEEFESIIREIYELMQYYTAQ
jgi:pimeloyl-ACP methyl ester carboxylesterase